MCSKSNTDPTGKVFILVCLKEGLEVAVTAGKFEIHLRLEEEAANLMKKGR